MKNLLFHFLIPAVLTISCEKDLDSKQEDQIIGTWSWIVSCGGFTGGCWYPSEDNDKQLIIDHTTYIEKQNDVVTLETQYQIVDTVYTDSTPIYRIEFSDSRQTSFWFSNNRLCIEGGDFVEEYKRN